jgi:ribosomal protein S18 acetylase RimI-like enzyme
MRAGLQGCTYARREIESAPADVVIRPAAPPDIDDLLRIEERSFASDRIRRRSFRRFVASPSSALLVAVRHRTLIGYALVLFRATSGVARLYSIAIAPEAARRGIGVALLAAAEQATIARQRTRLRLEVHEKNAAAISRYRKSGYVMFGRYAAYYADGGHALRFEKRLTPGPAGYPGQSACRIGARHGIWQETVGSCANTWQEGHHLRAPVLPRKKPVR